MFPLNDYTPSSQFAATDQPKWKTTIRMCLF